MNSKIDEKVATLIMGWAPSNSDFYLWMTPDGNSFGDPLDPWSPTTNVIDDYQVLQHVRKVWTFDERYRFSVALVELMRSRKAVHPVMAYEPGDYAKAALAAKEAP